MFLKKGWAQTETDEVVHRFQFDWIHGCRVVVRDKFPKWDMPNEIKLNQDIIYHRFIHALSIESIDVYFIFNGDESFYTINLTDALTVANMTLLMSGIADHLDL